MKIEEYRVEREKLRNECPDAFNENLLLYIRIALVTLIIPIYGIFMYTNP